MAAKKTTVRGTATKKPIEQYEHRDKKRVNNPAVGSVTPEYDRDCRQQSRSSHLREMAN